MKALLVFLTISVVPLSSLASDGFFLWHQVTLKDGNGGYVDVAYDDPYLRLAMRYGASNISSDRLRIAAEPDLGRIRLQSATDRSGGYVNFLEIGLVAGQCSYIRFYLGKNKIAGTQYKNCVVKGLVKRVRKPDQLMMSFAVISALTEKGMIIFAYPYSESNKLPELGRECRFTYDEQSIEAAVGGFFKKGSGNVIRAMDCTDKL